MSEMVSRLFIVLSNGLNFLVIKFIEEKIVGLNGIKFISV